jgi:hypothetical protein
MPRTRKDEAPLLVDTQVIAGRYIDIGGYTVSFETFPEDANGGLAFRRLPDDRSQCRHRGGDLAGRLILRFADRDEACYFLSTRATPAAEAAFLRSVAVGSFSLIALTPEDLNAARSSSSASPTCPSALRTPASSPSPSASASGRF